MTKSNNEWVPEIGKEYLLVSMSMCRMNVPVKITYTGKGVGCYERLSDGMEFTYSSSDAVFQEIKTEADKLRDEQIEQFKLKVFRGNGFALGESKETAIAIKAIDNGFRVLQPNQEAEMKDDLIFVGYTNGYQILYACDSGEGSFYNDTENECYIPIYMLKSHAHRIETTTGGNITLDDIEAITNAKRVIGDES